MRSNCLHLRQVVADGFRAAADPRVVTGEGLGEFGEVQRQRFHRCLAATAHRIMAEAGVLHLVGQEGLDLALGRRGKFDRDLAVQLAGHGVQEQLGGCDVAKFCNANLAEVRLAVLSGRRAACRGADVSADPPLERIELDPVFEAVCCDRTLDAAVFHVDCHGYFPFPRWDAKR